MSIIDSRKQELESLIKDKKVIPFAIQGLDLCLETMRTAKCIYQELFGQEMNASSPEHILKIYNSLVSSETEIAVRHATEQLRSRKNEELQEVEYRNLYGFGKSIAS
jgi:2-hydroxychromene-2-carboxylate isomerase